MSNNPLKGSTGVDETAGAAAAAAAAAATAAIENQEYSSSQWDNKWSKNGYGEGVARRQTGKFSKEESEVVRDAVKDFCAMKQISVARLCSECDHKAELKGAWMEIAKRLPHRSVQSVYRHGLRQLHPFKRGTWTEEECEILVDLVQRMGKKWASIQQKLNRSADACRDKYREMSDDYIKGRWKENETELLKRLIREHLNADPTADIKELGKHVEAEGIKIPWSIISKRMHKRSRLSCFKKWQKMTGLYSPSDAFKLPSKDDDGDGDGDGDGGGGGNEPSSMMTIKEEPRQEVSKSQSSVPATSETTDVEAAAAAPSVIARVAVNNPVAVSAPATAPSADYDLYLLSELASLGVTRSSEVNWEGLRLENAEERWNGLQEEWQADNSMDDSMLSLPLSEIAQVMLDRKTSAQRAAETVEAVDLPTPETLIVREI